MTILKDWEQGGILLQGGDGKEIRCIPVVPSKNVNTTQCIKLKKKVDSVSILFRYMELS